MEYLRKLPACTVITHGKEPEVFSLPGGLHIASLLPGSEVGEEFNKDLYEVLDRWFKDGNLDENYFSARCSAIRASHRKQDNNHCQERG